MADGEGCICYARHSGECACDADWTPQEVIDLRAKIAEQAEIIGKLVRGIMAAKEVYTDLECRVLDDTLKSIGALPEREW